MNRSNYIPLIEALEQRQMLSVSFFVSTSGNDKNSGQDPAHAWRHVQKAFNSATPGSTVNVMPGTYSENLEMHVSGSAAGGTITFKADGPIGSVIINGKANADVIHIENRNYIRIDGFELKSSGKLSDASGIRVEGAASHIDIENNRIHHIHGTDAMGITIYGDATKSGIHDLTINGNEIYDCQPSESEALTLNGNVFHFAVTNNYVHDVNNIGIDFIGGEGIGTDGKNNNLATDTARDGVCSGNRVVNAHSRMDHSAAGIYVDGGKNIVLERNTVSSCDDGVEVGCEHHGRIASGIVVRDNVIFNNDKAGLSIGGYDPSVGLVENCQFLNNTLYQNVRLKGYFGELTLTAGSNNTIENNLIDANSAGHLIYSIVPISTYKLDYNLFYTDAGAKKAVFVLTDQRHTGFSSYRSITHEDSHSLFAAPLLKDPAHGDFHLLTNSPAINAGVTKFKPGAGETDIDGGPRVERGRVDIGADEAR